MILAASKLGIINKLALADKELFPDLLRSSGFSAIPAFISPSTSKSGAMSAKISLVLAIFIADLLL